MVISWDFLYWYNGIFVLKKALDLCLITMMTQWWRCHRNQMYLCYHTVPPLRQLNETLIHLLLNSTAWNNHADIICQALFDLCSYHILFLCRWVTYGFIGRILVSGIFEVVLKVISNLFWRIAECVSRWNLSHSYKIGPSVLNDIAIPLHRLCGTKISSCFSCTRYTEWWYELWPKRI